MVCEAGRGVGGELVGLEVAFGGFGLEVILDELLGGKMAGGAVAALGRDREELLGERVDGLARDACGRGLLGVREGGEGEQEWQHEKQGILAVRV